jgi:hypothetical protein
MSFRKELEKRKINTFAIAMSLLIIIFFAIIVAIFSRIFPQEILFFGVVPMSFQYFIWGLFTFLITTFTIIFVLSRERKRYRR